jgi:NAD(P)-dependent dehydrogenase (short-subunit alcohol dehydrogenase family)
LVTGGARRVGKAIAIELARRGARVAIHVNSSIDQANELAALLVDRYGTDVAIFQAELTDEGAAEDLVHRVARHFACTGEACDEHAGVLDILVNSAAIWPETPFEEFGASDVRKCLDVNTVAPLVLAKHAGLWMVEQESGGVIINMGDAATAPDGKPYRDYPAYHPSKAAIPGMTRMLAVELSRRNKRVRVNAVLPGPVICQHLPGEPIETDERKDEARYVSLIRTGEEGGYGKAEHVAHAVAMLVENPFMTGVVLPVDGGGRLR